MPSSHSLIQIHFKSDAIFSDHLISTHSGCLWNWAEKREHSGAENGKGVSLKYSTLLSFSYANSLQRAEMMRAVFKNNDGEHLPSLDHNQSDALLLFSSHVHCLKMSSPAHYWCRVICLAWKLVTWTQRAMRDNEKVSFTFESSYLGAEAGHIFFHISFSLAKPAELF